MVEEIRIAGIDVTHIAATDPVAAPTVPYLAPRLIDIAAATRLVRGGGGMSGNDCRYYYYFTTGPYGC